MSSSENPIPVVQSPVSENTHVVVLTMGTPFGLMQVTSAPMRVSEASMTASDYMARYVETKEPWQSPILDVSIQRK
jgi:hypothetical protein